MPANCVANSAQLFQDTRATRILHRLATVQDTTLAWIDYNKVIIALCNNEPMLAHIAEFSIEILRYYNGKQTARRPHIFC